MVTITFLSLGKYKEPQLYDFMTYYQPPNTIPNPHPLTYTLSEMLIGGSEQKDKGK